MIRHLFAHNICLTVVTAVTAVQISRTSLVINLNQSKSVNAIRFHLSVVCNCTTSIHKSQINLQNGL